MENKNYLSLDKIDKKINELDKTLKELDVIEEELKRKRKNCGFCLSGFLTIEQYEEFENDKLNDIMEKEKVDSVDKFKTGDYYDK